MVIGFFMWRNNCWYVDYMKLNDIRFCVIFYVLIEMLIKKIVLNLKNLGY